MARKIPALAAVFLLIAASIVSLVLYHEKVAVLEAEESKLKAYVDDHRSAYADAIRIETDAAQMRMRTYELKNVLLGIASRPDPDESQYSGIFDLGGDTVSIADLSYDRTAGVLGMRVECAVAEELSRFVARLRISGMFEDILHDGYRETGAENEPVFAADLTCVVKGTDPALPDAARPLPVYGGSAEEGAAEGVSRED
ncbi:MAG: hypothetical protein LBO81_02880 [Clostridiales Family XIII bacterium]|jgi:hypothetical protein|nr:hypothetical protein [Clostridiales Family XIII bacterium]